MKIQITCRFSAKVLFEHTCENNSLKLTLEAAVLARANLGGANLGGANLGGANLDGANLGGANLDGAYLGGANLDGANLDGANLGGANLGGANLDGAYLGGANLDGANLGGANLDGAYLGGAYLGGDKTLIGQRPFIQIGPIGSRSAFLTAFLTDKGIHLKTGCFSGTLDEFKEAVLAEHGENIHAKEYESALQLIETHSAFWLPKTAELKEVVNG
ncbi:MAG: pentapeptide repeat-containing protein [Polynucleobacter sp.]|nr:pentapeptide repeat-containing protein [Polynucleobacter sp.]